MKDKTSILLFIVMVGLIVVFSIFIMYSVYNIQTKRAQFLNERCPELGLTVEKLVENTVGCSVVINGIEIRFTYQSNKTGEWLKVSDDFPSI